MGFHNCRRGPSTATAKVAKHFGLKVPDNSGTSDHTSRQPWRLLAGERCPACGEAELRTNGFVVHCGACNWREDEAAAMRRDEQRSHGRSGIVP